MKKSILLFILFLMLAGRVLSQWSPEERERIGKLNQEDHQLMMKMQGISEIRPGPSGDPKAPNAANSDESKATQYTSLPDPLVFNDGAPVHTTAQWEDRKLEILEDFDREVYGRVPETTPAVTWEVTSEKDTVNGDFPVTVKKLIGRVDNSGYPAITVDIEMSLTVPKPVNSPLPVIMEFGFNFPKSWRMPQPAGPTWQQQVLAKGWGYAILVPVSIQADNGAGLREGIIGLVNMGQPRKPDDWGALRAWAWGASRAMDYFETNPDVDETRVVIEGLSRYGKAALVALAYEPRIAMGCIGSSGAGGAKILRRIFGEQVENLASSAEYHWFAPNFIKYAGPLTAVDLPVDAHELVALCAPRPVFISVGSPAVEGQWIDAKGMFLAGVHAGPVYELLGKKGLGTAEFPSQETSLIDGEIAFRQHEGGHTVGPNWPFFLAYADRYFSNPARSSGPAEKWIGTWGTAPQLVEPGNMPPEPGLSGSTLRQVVRVSLGGDSLRVRFSNEFSTSPVIMKAVHLAAAAGGSEIDPGTGMAVLFDGKPEVTIAPGTAIASDPFGFALAPCTDVAITIYFGETSTDVTGHPGSRTTSYLLAGNHVFAADLSGAVTTDHWYIINGIDVMAPESAGAVAILGNSITDGRGSGTNRQNRWPDVLARRLQENPDTREVAVLNMGIGGNCVLRDCLGPAALSRFERDIIGQNGVRWLIILEGINDIGQIQNAEQAAKIGADLIAAYEQMIDAARAAGIKVYGATLLPFAGSFYDTPDRETAWKTVNAWIRNSGRFDAVIDLDAAMRNPEEPMQLVPAGDTGDHLHPNETGHRMMGEAVDMTLFNRDKNRP